MKSTKTKILVIGGYGAVGAILSRKMAEKYPEKLLIAGRNKSKAQELIGKHNLKAQSVFFDLKDISLSDTWLDTVHTAICCIEYLQDDKFIHCCIEKGINYLELATSYEAYLRLLKYQDDFAASNLMLIPGVGLMPGLSGVFAINALSVYPELHSISSFVLLGLGEKHGLDAIRWMIEFANKSFVLETDAGPHTVQTFSDPLKTRLLHEQRPRTFYRFDFGDQHIMNSEMPVKAADTRLAFEIRWINMLIRFCKKMGLLAWIRLINPKTIHRLLGAFPMGSDQFAVQTICKSGEGEQITYLAHGRNEARATAIIGAYVVEEVYEKRTGKGLIRMEELVSFKPFRKYLQANKIEIFIE